MSKPARKVSSNPLDEMMAVSNHVFTCVNCLREWTMYSDSKLECFFLGLCYWCIREHKLTMDEIEGAIQKLLKRRLVT